MQNVVKVSLLKSQSIHLEGWNGHEGARSWSNLIPVRNPVLRQRPKSLSATFHLDKT